MNAVCTDVLIALPNLNRGDLFAFRHEGECQTEHASSVEMGLCKRRITTLLGSGQIQTVSEGIQ
jgi:hypothetical protein